VPTAVRERWVVECRELTGPDALQLTRRPSGTPAEGQYRIRIEACGVNFPDLLMTRGEYQLRLPAPFVPGLEAAGVIEEAGAGTSQFACGDRVVANLAYGLYASEAIALESQLTRAPEGFSAAESATYFVAAFTAWHALGDRALLKPGETVLVLGAGGGVGLAAVEVAALMGARVIAAASSAAKLEVARSYGATDSIDYSDGALVDKLRAIAPNGVDVIFDPIGGTLGEQALRLPAANGRLLVVGFASGRIGQIPANLPLIKGYSVIGVRAGEAARRDPALSERGRRQLAHWTQQGRLRPNISHRFALGDAAMALRALEQRTAIGRIVLLPP
jgi:NADPH2:quinone reductase